MDFSSGYCWSASELHNHYSLNKRRRVWRVSKVGYPPWNTISRPMPIEGAVIWLFGAFCALWAQNTGRNPSLWFFLGLLFSVITVLVLFSKNSNDKRLRLQPV